MYFSWMNDIQDWCISRQLWWGHRIPAWYDAEGKFYVGNSEEDVRAKYNLAADLELNQDNIYRELKLTQLQIQGLDENIIRRGCPGIAL